MRRFSSLSALLSALILPFTSACDSVPQRDIQPLPLSVNDRWILDAKNQTFAFVGVNWAGHEQTMLPEGLQYQSIPNIVTKIAEIGFNSVRLTFATQMVDDIVEGGGDVTLKTTLQNALGPENGTTVMNQIMKNNPGFNESTKRLEVWNAVADELARQNIFLHLDNHVSKAGWCCKPEDGNSWFGDIHFNTSNWVRSLSFMAEHGKANWKSFSSMGLRNEIRDATIAPPSPTLEPMTWETWKTRMLQGANAVHNANPDILIFFGGRLLDVDISAPVNGKHLSEPNFNFSIAEQPFRNKFIFEQHQYDQTGLVGDNCTSYVGVLNELGSNAVSISGPGTNRAPLVMGEWGHDQTDDSGVFKHNFRTCLMQFMIEQRINWMVWVIGGSYYIREGTADRDEPWALLDHTWSSYRGKESIKQLQKDMKQTYAAFNMSIPAAAKDVSSAASVRFSCSVAAATFVSMLVTVLAVSL
ncbi:cellulase family protein [Colletotrichum truncatum]|uniref:Cellulase family protein n=1 Tax=Colletotrichum truncatum TaxID=5467 RepID=A0ACC3YU39_COLTU|nr:cellulase family protein [Colletotrichum truncatum]KAF6798644.1 cellulase family protein [Colletotrichum truncatum]